MKKKQEKEVPKEQVWFRWLLLLVIVVPCRTRHMAEPDLRRRLNSIKDKLFPETELRKNAPALSPTQSAETQHISSCSLAPPSPLAPPASQTPAPGSSSRLQLHEMRPRMTRRQDAPYEGQISLTQRYFQIPLSVGAVEYSSLVDDQERKKRLSPYTCKEKTTKNVDIVRDLRARLPTSLYCCAWAAVVSQAERKNSTLETHKRISHRKF